MEDRERGRTLETEASGRQQTKTRTALDLHAVMSNNNNKKIKDI